MMNTEMLVGLLAGVALVLFGYGILELINRRRGMKHHDSHPKFKVSPAPKPVLENTVKVRGRRSTDRPVIRATQMRGKARRKF